jgi:hypothetical protein
VAKQAEDLTGKVFGNLEVIKFHHKKRKNPSNGQVQGHRYFWLCKCLLCGGTAIVPSSSLKGMKSTSCGCLTRKRASEVNTKHGHANERLYHVWQGMKDRCFNPNHHGYHNYGGRGITICNEWMDYANFRKFMIGIGYDENLKRGVQTLERIDVNGNYEPSNCKLIPFVEQSLNRRNSHKVLYNGEEKTISEWAKVYKMNQNTLGHRLREGWPIEKALLTPVRHPKKH